jgi:hypothetical protein
VARGENDRTSSSTSVLTSLTLKQSVVNSRVGITCLMPSTISCSALSSSQAAAQRARVMMMPSACDDALSLRGSKRAAMPLLEPCCQCMRSILRLSTRLLLNGPSVRMLWHSGT